MTTLDVCCASEAAYAPHAATMLHSLLAVHDDTSVSVHFLHGDEMPPGDRDRLRAMVEDAGARIDFVRVEAELVEDLPKFGQPTHAMWYRTFAPELLPDLDEVIYIDVDTVVMDTLVPLAQIDVSDHWLAAVTNVFQHNHVYRPAELGLPGPEAYFNSGVLLLNLEAMRRDGCSDAVRQCALERSSQMEWWDQDALNIVLSGRRLELHPRWNVMNAVLHFREARSVFGADRVAEARRNPAVRHFEGPRENKPWNYMCTREMRDAYVRHRRQTPWPEVKLDDVSPCNAARRLLRGPRRAQALAELRTGAALTA